MTGVTEGSTGDRPPNSSRVRSSGTRSSNGEIYFNSRNAVSDRTTPRPRPLPYNHTTLRISRPPGPESDWKRAREGWGSDAKVSNYHTWGYRSRGWRIRPCGVLCTYLWYISTAPKYPPGDPKPPQPWWTPFLPGRDWDRSGPNTKTGLS